MKTLYFIRHGATAGNLQRRYIGCTDEPLCPLGLSQLEGLRGRVPAVDRLFVSPMLRTRQTARLLYPGMEQILVPDFRETDFGIFEGKTYGELTDCREYRAWVDSGCTGPIPGGESVADFKDRCCRAFDSLLAQIPGEGTAALVVHGGVIMAILEARALPKRGFYDYHIQNGAMLGCICCGDSLYFMDTF